MSARPRTEAGNARSPDYILVSAPPPVVLAYGIGVDSTALLVELEARGEAPDLVLSADPGAEKPETYAYQEMIAAWMAARGIPYEVGIARFRETSRGHIMGLEHGMLKMLFSLKTRRVLGVQIVGEGATELIHIGQAVINLQGTVDFFVENTFNYQTLAEAYKVAALDVMNKLRALHQFRS